MKHFGDITKLSGYDLPIVDCIIGGSPCQDLSVAGNREGLKGARSGLFMEQVRIVKEMRECDRINGRTDWSVRPRYMVWENVPGAFSSNGGRDFRIVLSEIVKIAEPNAPDVPMPDKGKWPKAGCLYDEMGGWSVAYRLHDAQFWGVPQRRKRISLVADFGGLAAPEVLFERKGLSWDSDEGGAAREEAAGDAGRRAAETGGAIPINDKATRFQGGGPTRNGDGAGNGLGIGSPGDPSPTLSTADRHAVYCEPEITGTLTSRNGGGPCPKKGSGAQIVTVAGFKHNASKSANGIGFEAEKAQTLISGQESAVYDARGNRDGTVVSTIVGDHENRVTDYTALCVGNGQLNQMSMAQVSNTLDTMHDQQAVYCVGIVRRLTPQECERLQGYPDDWTKVGDRDGAYIGTDGKRRKVSDGARYKALGNSIAIPFWFWLLRRISAQYERPATLGSLFDGIGGFPLCWERCNGSGTALWASEIEEFCIAVTKTHFPE